MQLLHKEKIYLILHLISLFERLGVCSVTRRLASALSRIVLNNRENSIDASIFVLRRSRSIVGSLVALSCLARQTETDLACSEFLARLWLDDLVQRKFRTRSINEVINIAHRVILCSSVFARMTLKGSGFREKGRFKVDVLKGNLVFAVYLRAERSRLRFVRLWGAGLYFGFLQNLRDPVLVLFHVLQNAKNPAMLSLVYDSVILVSSDVADAAEAFLRRLGVLGDFADDALAAVEDISCYIFPPCFRSD